MEPKRSKYDTNPLDEDVAHRADERFGRKGGGASTEDIGGVTHPIDRAAPETSRRSNQSEAPTRRIDDKVTSYPSVFVPPPPRRPSATYEPPRINSADVYRPPPVPPASVYQAPPVPIMGPPGLHKVEGLGIPERWALILPYLPFWLAIVASVIELLLVPRTESKVRFHAAQGLILQLGITALTMLLTFAGFVTGRFTGASLVNSVSFVFLIIAMIRVWKGKPLVIPLLDEPRKWLDEKIKPRK